MQTNSPGGVDLKAGRDGFLPSDDDLFWLAAMRQVQMQAILATHWAAVGVLAASLAGWFVVTIGLVYAAIHGPAQAASFEFMIVPLILWSASIAMALRVFSLRRYRYFANSPDSAQQAITRIARKKSRHLHWAVGLWVAGALVLIVALIADFIP